MIEKISSLSGRYTGRGVNHEGQNFTGVFVAHPLSQGLSFTFNATGDDGQLYHEEASLIGKNMAGQPGLWVLSLNHPGVFERTLKKHDVTMDIATYIFGFGDIKNINSFREEILIEVKAKSVKYVYSWGLPGGEFAERSGCTMTLAE